MPAAAEADFHDALGRMGPIATIDVVGTAVVAFAFARFVGWNPWRTIAFAFVLGEMVHLYFCLQTPVTEVLGMRSGKRSLTKDSEGI
jgi:hypothetical protein